MVKVLMLSGAGWLGHHIANKLIEHGHQVTTIHLSMEERFVPFLASDVQHILGDVNDSDLCQTVFERTKPDIIIDVKPSPRLIERNYQMFKGRISHYLHCSSAGVYVPTGKEAATEDAPTYSIESFGDAFINKKRSDEMAMSRHSPSVFPVTIVRPVIILGKGFTPLELWGFRNPAFFDMIKNGQEITVSSQTNVMMSVVHVKHVAEIFVQSVLNPDKSSGQIFNATSFEPFTHDDYLRTIGNVLGREPKPKYVGTEELIRLKAGQSMFYEADYRFFMSDLAVSGEKSKKLLDVQTQITLSDLLQEGL